MLLLQQVLPLIGHFLRLPGLQTSLLMGAVWFLLIGRFMRGPSLRSAILMGLVLGLGLLTKGFFVPIAIGTILAMALNTIQQGRSIFEPLLTALVAGSIGLLWYGYPLVMGEGTVATNDLANLTTVSGGVKMYKNRRFQNVTETRINIIALTRNQWLARSLRRRTRRFTRNSGKNTTF